MLAIRLYTGAAVLIAASGPSNTISQWHQAKNRPRPLHLGVGGGYTWELKGKTSTSGAREVS